MGSLKRGSNNPIKRHMLIMMIKSLSLQSASLVDRRINTPALHNTSFIQIGLPVPNNIK